MLEQYSRDLQAIPGLLHAIDHHMTPTHANHPAPPPTPTIHEVPNTPEAPPDPPPQISPQPPPTDDQARKWRPRQYPLTIPSSSTSPRWSQLIQDPSELDIKSYSCGQETDLNAGTLNIGGSLRERITDITFTFAAAQMDYLCLQDTRQTKREVLIIANLIRDLLPPGSLVIQAPITKAKPSDPPPIGGQMILVSHRWSHHANQWYTDPTQRGLLTGITLSNRHSKIRLLSSYWPVPHAANQHSLTPCPRCLIPPTAQSTPRISGYGPASSTHLYSESHHARNAQTSTAAKPSNHPAGRPKL